MFSVVQRPVKKDMFGMVNGATGLHVAWPKHQIAMDRLNQQEPCEWTPHVADVETIGNQPCNVQTPPLLHTLPCQCRAQILVLIGAGHKAFVPNKIHPGDQALEPPLSQHYFIHKSWGIFLGVDNKDLAPVQRVSSNTPKFTSQIF